MNESRWMIVTGLVFLACLMLAQERFASGQFLTRMRDETASIRSALQTDQGRPADTAAVSAALERAASHAHRFGIALWSVPASLCLILLLFVGRLSQRMQRAEKLLADLKR